MSVFLKKDSKNWYYSFRIHGQRHSKTTGTSDREEALRFEAKVRREIEQSMAPRKTPAYTRTTLGSIIGSVKAATGERSKDRGYAFKNLDYLVWALGPGFLVEQISADVIRFQIMRAKILSLLEGRRDFDHPMTLDEALERAGLHPHPGDPKLTLEDLCKILPKAESYASKRFKKRRPLSNSAILKIVVHPIFKIIDVAQQSFGLYLPESPDRSAFTYPIATKLTFLPIEYDELLFRSVPKERADIYEFALETALRVGGIANLRWQDVDLASGTVKATVKGGEQHLELTERAQQILSEQWGKHPQFVFTRTNKDGEIVRITTAIGQQLTKDLESLGVFGLTFHSLRRTAAQRMYDSDIPVHVVQRYLGHRSVMMTWRYIGRSPNEPVRDILLRRELLQKYRRGRIRDGGQSALSPREEALSEWLLSNLASLPLARLMQLVHQKPAVLVPLLHVFAGALPALSAAGAGDDEAR